MTTGPLWRSIAATLASEIDAGSYPPGARLPSEAVLARRFGVNRHTVRRALAGLGDRVHSRRGAGVYVLAQGTDYPLGERVRFAAAMEASGRMPARRFLRIETRPAQTEEARALGLEAGAPVHLVEGVSLADGLPMALFLSVFPAVGLPGFPQAVRDLGSVTSALAACGVADYTRLSTRLTAVAADPVAAGHLRIAAGDPLLRSAAVNVDPAGRPVEYGLSWFVGARITLTVEPPPARG